MHALGAVGRWISVIACVLATSAAVGQSTPAQPEKPTDATAQTAAATDAATIPFVDNNLGYELRVPTGWRYDRTGFFGPGGSVGLIRGVSPDGLQTIQVLAFRAVRQAAFGEWVEAFVQQLGQVPGLVWAVSTPNRESKLPAAYVLAESRDGLDRWRTVYYCVQFDTGTHWVLVHSVGLGKGGEIATPPAEEFIVELVPVPLRDIIGTLRVFYDPQAAIALTDALERGKQYVQALKLQEDVRTLRAEDKTKHYVITLNATPIGLMTRQVVRQKQSLDDPRYKEKGKDGVRVRETLWRFGDDGSASYSVLDLFSSVDGATDMFEIWQSAVPADEKLPPLTTRDQCIREGELLFSSMSTSAASGLPEPRVPIKTGGAYLGLAWGRLLPALLGKKAGEAHAFSMYNSETRALLTQSIRFVDERPLPEGDKKKKARVFELRDGFSQSVQLLYTDEFGTLLRAESGEVTVKAVSEAEATKLLGAKRDAAKKRLDAK
ncbi:MAG: hypothetical protein ACKVS9_08610 [Phycisphaerae bacterium]